MNAKKRKGLPYRDALKMGFDGLLKRKVRFVVSVLMTCLVLVIFGLNLTMLNYDPAKVFLQAMYDDGNRFVRGTATTDEDFLYSALDGFDSINYSYFGLNTILAPKGLFELTEQNAKSFGFKLLAGKFPATDNEIMLTAYQFKLFKDDSGYLDYYLIEDVQIAEYKDLLGKKIGLSERFLEHWGNFIICGIIDTNCDISKHETIQELERIEQTRPSMRLTEKEKKLYNSCYLYLNNNAHTAMFVAPNVISKIGKTMNYELSNSVLWSDVRMYSNDMKNSQEAQLHILTKGALPIYKKNNSSVPNYTGNNPSEVFWLDGQPREKLSGNEIILPLQRLLTIDIEERPLPEQNIVLNSVYSAALDKTVDSYVEANYNRLETSLEDYYKRHITKEEFWNQLHSWITLQDRIENEFMPELKKDVFIASARDAVIEYCTKNPLSSQILRYSINPDGSYNEVDNVKVVGFYIPQKTEDYTFFNTIYMPETLYDIVAPKYSKNIVVALSGDYYKDLALIRNSNTFRLDGEVVITSGSVPIVFENELTQPIIEIDKMIRLINDIVIYAFIGIAIIAFFMMLNFFSATVADDKNLIIILRSLGTSKKDLLKIYLLRSIVIIIACLILSILGMFIGTIVLNNYFVARLGLAFSPLVFDLLVAAIVVAFAVPLVLVSTIIPVVKIAMGKLNRVSE